MSYESDGPLDAAHDALASYGEPFSATDAFSAADPNLRTSPDAVRAIGLEYAKVCALVSIADSLQELRALSVLSVRESERRW